ncbi:MAG: hypothetical protein ACI395_03120, partial [Candidatus Cryptobacteroides sp.]
MVSRRIILIPTKKPTEREYFRSLFPDEFKEGERGGRELPEGNDRPTMRSLTKKSPERNEKTGEYQSGQMGQTVNLLVYTF